MNCYEWTKNTGECLHDIKKMGFSGIETKLIKNLRQNSREGETVEVLDPDKTL